MHEFLQPKRMPTKEEIHNNCKQVHPSKNSAIKEKHRLQNLKVHDWRLLDVFYDYTTGGWKVGHLKGH